MMIYALPSRRIDFSSHLNHIGCQLALIVCLLWSAAGYAHAQVGPSIVIDPWGEQPHWAQTYDDFAFITGGHTKGDDSAIKTFYYESHGRVKLDKDDPDPRFSIGYRYLTIELGSNHPTLPGGFSDVAVVGAYRLTEPDEDWQFSLVGGIGTANDNHFDNSDAIYGIGAFNAQHQIDEHTALHIGLSYNGNRVFLPDAPIPYVMYIHQVSEDLTYSLGAPASWVRWNPIPPLTIHVNYTAPVNISGEIAYAIDEQLSVFTAYKRTVDGFAVHGRDNRRLFYELNRITAGIRWNNPDFMDARLGIGYAFEQDYSFGYDLRDTDTVAELSDEFMFFLTLKGTF